MKKLTENQSVSQYPVFGNYSTTKENITVSYK